jgi:hypothetical protein
MPNLITQYTNGTFEGALGTWGAEFGPASTAQIQDPAEFFEGANSVKFTTDAISSAGFTNGSANFLLCRFPGVAGQPYEVTVRVKCNAAIPDGCFFFAEPWAFGTTQGNIGFMTPMKASFAKAGWVELKANFYGDTITGEIAFNVNVLFNTQELNAALQFESAEVQEFYSSLSTLVVSEVIPAGAFVWVDAMTADVVAVPVLPDLQFEGRRLYYIRNVFYIQVGAERTVIDEPIKWDQVIIQVIFDEKTKSYRFEFSDKDVLLEFDNAAGRQILKDLNKLLGTNAEAYLLFGEFNTITEELTIHYTGSINFADCEDGEKTFKANIERQSFGEKLRTYFDTPVDIFRETSLGGLARPALERKELYLHPRLLTEKASHCYNPNVPVAQALTPEDASPAVGDDGIVYTNITPFKQAASNIDGLQEPTSPDGLLIYAGFTLPAGISKRKFFIECGMSFSYTKTGSPQQPIAGFGVVKVSNITGGGVPTGMAISTSNPVGYAELHGILPGDYAINGSFSGTIELEADEALFFRTTIYNTVEGSPVVVYSNFQYTNPESFYLRITEQTVFAPSLISAPLIHEIVNRQLELIVDKADILRSNFLGRVSLGYSAEGCASRHIGANGKMVRKPVNKNGVINGCPPVVTESNVGDEFPLSAKDWFNSLDGLFCLGMSIERDVDENEFVRLEELPYFFRNGLLLKLNAISGYRKTPASKYLFNGLDFRFQKYPQDNQPDSIEDFHTAMAYITPLTKIMNKLSIGINAIVSGYYWEYTRREAFRTNPTNAYETDNDLFYASSKESVLFRAGASLVFDDTNDTITILDLDLYPIVPGEDLTIVNATGGVTNGTYRVLNVEIPFTYDRVILTIGAGLVPTNGAGTGDIDIDGVEERFQVKRDEDFETVTGVTSPKSVYNLEHQIKRIVLRWAKVFQAGWAFLYTGDPNQIIQGLQFTGEGRNNNKVRTKLNVGVACKYGDTLRQDRFDNGSEDVNGMDAPLFDKDQIEFNAPLTWVSFNYIRTAFEGRNPDGRDYGYIQIVNPDGEIERGYVINMKFDPNKQMCKFTLIKKYDA